LRKIAPNSIRNSLLIVQRRAADEKKSRIENERKIVSRVKREMDKLRLTESVRNGFSVQAAPTAKKPATRSALA